MVPERLSVHPSPPVVEHTLFLESGLIVPAFSQRIEPGSMSDQWADHFSKGDDYVSAIVLPRRDMIWGKAIHHKELLNIFHSKQEDRDHEDPMSYISVVAWPTAPIHNIPCPQLIVASPQPRLDRLAIDVIRYMKRNVGAEARNIGLTFDVNRRSSAYAPYGGPLSHFFELKM